MHLDLDRAEGDQDRSTEICIVGCGAAGLTAARHLLRLGHDVVLLESGGLDYEAATAKLNAGRNVGQNYYDLEDARLRFFGGTTAIWGGRLAELDPIDLAPRAWVPHSGWPIGWDELQPYYAPALRAFGIAGRGAAADLAAADVDLPKFDPEQIEIGVWTFDRRFNRFMFAASNDLVGHPRCTVITHATVTELVLDPSGRAVTRIDARSLSGRRLTVRADSFMLAAGGLENARLLLASRSVMPCGVGNGFDQVGRYFMEHPHARGGRLLDAGAWTLLRAFGRTHRVGDLELAALLKPSAAAQERQSILNSSLTIVARQPADASQSPGMAVYGRLKHKVAPTRRGRAMWMATKKGATWLQQRVDPLRPWLLHRLGLREIALLVRAEQAPNPDSRVMLTDQIDRLGMPRLALDWRTTELDVRSVAGLVDTLGVEIARLGLGRVERAEWLGQSRGQWKTDPLISAHPIGGYHHMGTTRMSASPRHGVTDAAGRVHGVDNLYVAGSSVFPTSGWANPTLTIAALAIRTSDRISAALARSRAA